MPEGAGRDGGAAIESVLELLRTKGGRVTASRRLLVQVLFAARGHQSAEELAAALQAIAPDVHLSTVYRNLEELERLGVVTHSHVGHGPATYHLATRVHGHLVCETCGTLFEVDEEVFNELAEHARARYGFVVDPHHFAVLGTCATCKAAQPVGG